MGAEVHSQGVRLSFAKAVGQAHGVSLATLYRNLAE